MNWYFRILLGLGFLTAACQPYSSRRVLKQLDSNNTAQCAADFTPQTIYGDDGRKDWWQVDSALKDHWAAATVALVRRSGLRNVAEGVELIGTAHGKKKNLCAGTRFEEQPEVAFCSGFLVAENLVVTAAHCVQDEDDCKRTQFVFDYAKNQEIQARFIVPQENVYRCRSIKKRDLFLSDYALIELDRTVSDRTPLNIRREGKITDGEPLIMIGHPSGLPSKITGGGEVVDSAGSQIFASVDAFAGNSGSPIINQRTGLVEGLLVAGEADYINTGTCREAFVCGEACQGEIITPIKDIASEIPAITYAAPEIPCID